MGTGCGYRMGYSATTHLIQAPHLHHKEEMPHRIELDRRDSGGLRSTLEGIIHSLDKSQISQHRELVNIFTGEYSEEGCDLHESINIGTIQCQEFEAALPDGFYDVIPRKVKPFKATRRNAQAPATETVNCDLIYSRTLGILNSGRDDVKIEDLLQYELSPVPLALFDKTTKSRSTDKSKLKSKLMIADTSRQKCDIAIIDASAVLRNLHWPGKGFIDREHAVLSTSFKYGDLTNAIWPSCRNNPPNCMA